MSTFHKGRVTIAWLVECGCALLFALLCTGVLWRAAFAALPTVRTAGAIASGTGAVTVALPGSSASGDLMILTCETQENETPSCASNCDTAGWTSFATSTGGSGATGSKITSFYQVHDGSGLSPVTNDPGDHIICRTQGFAAYYGSPPMNIVTANGTGVTTSRTSPAGSTWGTDCYVFWALSFADTANNQDTAGCTVATGADFSALAENIDNRRNAGNDGAICVQRGVKTLAGSFGPMASTTTNNSDGGNNLYSICGAAPPRRIFTTTFLEDKIDGIKAMVDGSFRFLMFPNEAQAEPLKDVQLVP
jgi:hypothetical protein